MLPGKSNSMLAVVPQPCVTSVPGHRGRARCHDGSGMRWGTIFRAGFGLWKKQAAIKEPLQSATLGQLAGPAAAKIGGADKSGACLAT